MKRNFCLVVLLVLCGVSFASAQQETSLNIAIIADKTGALNNSALISLLETQLSQNPNIQLVERTQIDTILQEQQLSAAGLLDRQTAIQVGRLLRADVFIIITLENSLPSTSGSRGSVADAQQTAAGDLIRVRVAETAHGLRLLDEYAELVQSNVTETAQQLADNIVTVVNKLSLPVGQAVPVGIVDIHRVQLGEQYKLLERTLPVILSVRLAAEPNLIMLEREDLQTLLDEKVLTEGDDSAFWGSAVLIEGNLQPDNGRLKMEFSLHRPGGQAIETFTVSVDPNEPSTAVAQAVTDIVEEIMDTPPAGQWQLADEAEQFYQQGQMLSNHQWYEDSIKLFETAHALRPDNVYYTGVLFNSEWELRKKIKSYFYQGNEKPYYSDLELAEIVSIYVHQISDWYEKGLLSYTDIRRTLEESLGGWDGTGGYFNRLVSVSTEKIKDINRDSRKIWLKTAQKSLDENPRLDVKIGMAWASSDVPEEVFSVLHEVIVKVDLNESFWLVMQHLFYPPISSNTDSIRKTQFRDSAEECWDLWLQYIQEFTESKDPLLKFISCLAMYENKAPQGEDYRLKSIDILKHELNTPNEAVDENVKQMIRYIMKLYLTRTEFEEFLVPLVENKDIPNLIIWNPGGFDLGFLSQRDTVEHWYQFLEQISQIMQTQKNDVRVTEALNNIIDKQAEIKKRYPEIGILQTTWNQPVIMILKEEDWPNKIINNVQDIQVFLQNQIFWIAFAGRYSFNKNERTGVFIKLAGIDLTKRDPIALWQTNIPYSDPLGWGEYRNLSGMAISEDVTYVSHNGGGIVEFPGSSIEGREFIENPKIITQVQGLPSVYITSITKFEDKLYVAYGDFEQESGLSSYDSKAKKWETIFCSTLKGKSPFNNRQPYMIYSLADVIPDKLYFYLYDPEKGYLPLNSKDLEGFWEMDINNHEVRYIGLLASRTGSQLQIEQNGSGLLFRTQSHLVQYDPNMDIFTIIMGWPLRFMTSSSNKNLSEIKIKQDIFTTETSMNSFDFGSFRVGKLDLQTAAIHEDRLWARLGESQILIVEKGKSYEDAQIIENNLLDGQAVERFVSTPYGLIGIGQGCVGLIETE